jgi:Type VI secretion system (T6SS), amidase effector protein 4
MMAKPAFSTLRSNYRVYSTQIHACTMSFPNTCAIRMSEALARCDPAFTQVFRSSGKNVCPHGYVRGAQDLGAVLQSSAGFGSRQFGWNGSASGTPPAAALGKKGLVCYMTIPGFGGQGHIDLWDGSEAVGSAYWNAATIWMWTLP